jgi:hypothetical protein
MRPLDLKTMHRIALLAVCFLTAGWAAPLAAAQSQWTVAAFLGDAWTANAPLRVQSLPDGTDIALEGVEYDDRSFDFPIYYGVRAGRFLSSVPWFGLEGEFVHLKTITSPDQLVDADGTLRGQVKAGPLRVGDVLPRFELSHGLNLVLANASVRVPLGGPVRSSPVILTARFGIGPTIPHVEGTYGADTEDAYQWSSLGWQLAGGTEIRAWRALIILSEVKFTRTHQHVTIDQTEVSGLFRTVHLVFGTGWAF